MTPAPSWDHATAAPVEAAQWARTCPGIRSALVNQAMVATATEEARQQAVTKERASAAQAVLASESVEKGEGEGEEEDKDEA